MREMRVNRKLTPEEMKILYEEQVEVAVPIVLQIWEEIQRERGQAQAEDRTHDERAS